VFIAIGIIEGNGDTRQYGAGGLRHEPRHKSSNEKNNIFIIFLIDIIILYIVYDLCQKSIDLSYFITNFFYLNQH
jgi:hypothetical protein